jgi:hypothetical protein
MSFDIVTAQYIEDNGLNYGLNYEKSDLPKAYIIPTANDTTVINLSDENTVMTDNDIIVSYQSKCLTCPHNCKAISFCVCVYGCCFCVCLTICSEMFPRAPIKIL